ncbi:MAG: hypothetical protein NTW50_03935 [Candidatus Berkelbacteria bacterium]|nr:hypothetical protein [Candidatus Berkelbacteria bacterium]
MDNEIEYYNSPRHIIKIVGMLSFFLIALGVLGLWLLPKFKADSSTRIVAVTLSGTSTDPSTKKAVVGAAITVGAKGLTTAKATTNASGAYTINLQVDLNKADQRHLTISQYKSDIPINEDNITSLTVPVLEGSSKVNLVQNFNLMEIPGYSSTGVEGSAVRTATPTTCSTTIIPATFGGKTITFVSKTVSVGTDFSMTFCGIKDGTTSPSGSSILDAAANQSYLQLLAQQTKYLKQSTSIAVPPVYMIKFADYVPIFSTKNAGIYFDKEERIFLNAPSAFSIINSNGSTVLNIDGEEILAHEFGHHLDNEGSKIDVTTATPGCWFNAEKNNYHCLQSSSDNFVKAYDGSIDVGAIDNTISSGSYNDYAATNPQEMFAEFFEAIMTKRNLIAGEPATTIFPDNLLLRYRLNYMITHYLEYSSSICSPLDGSTSSVAEWTTSSSQTSFDFTRISYFNLKHTTDAANTLMYLYAFVANSTGAPTLYPANLSSTVAYEGDIINGSAFSQGVVLVLTQNTSDKPTSLAKVNIGSLAFSPGTTSDKDMLSANGIDVNYSVPALANQTITVSPKTGSLSLTSTPNKVSIQKGANQIVGLTINGLPTGFAKIKEIGLIGDLINPRGITVDGQKNVYVTDSGRSQIVEYDSCGSKMRTFGSAGTTAGKFNYPTGIYAEGGYLDVVDSGNSRIQRAAISYPALPNFNVIFGSSGTGPGKFTGVQDVVANSSLNKIYVADGASGTGGQVQIFNNSGAYQSKISPFSNASAVATVPSGDVYVLESQMGGPAATAFTVYHYNSSGVLQKKWDYAGAGKMQLAHGLAVDLNGKVYVADPDNSRVVIFDSNGTKLDEITYTYPNPGYKSAPYDVAVDSSGNVYILDNADGNIKVFSK